MKLMRNLKQKIKNKYNKINNKDKDNKILIC